MKRILTLNKLILTLMVITSPLYATINTQINKTIELLKETDRALEGWSKLQYKWLWSKKDQEATISSSCLKLKRTQQELATTLARLNSNPEQDHKAVLRESAAHIKQYAPPSYFRRNGIRYATVAVGLMGSAYFLSRNGYDDEGQHIVENFYTHHITEPIINMYNILTNKNVNPIVLKQDPKAALKYIERKTNLDIENAKRDPRLKEVAASCLDITIPVEEIPQKDKIAFSKAKRTFHTIRLAEQVDQFTWMDVLSIKIPEDLKHTIESTNTVVEWVDIEKMFLAKKLEEISKKLNLTIEFLAATPALVGSYFCLKSIGKYFTHYKVNIRYKPLKKILIKLQLQHNQERYTNLPSPAVKGMNIYWLSQLKEAIPHIPVVDRTAYSEYLERLEDNTLQPKQKITIIENMLRDISCLQQI